MAIESEDLLRIISRVERLRMRLAHRGDADSLQQIDVIQRRLGVILSELIETNEVELVLAEGVERQEKEIAELKQTVEAWMFTAETSVRKSEQLRAEIAQKDEMLHIAESHMQSMILQSQELISQVEKWQENIATADTAQQKVMLLTESRIRIFEQQNAELRSQLETAHRVPPK